MINKITQGNVLNGFPEIPDKFVNCCITSPPYWGLRDYGVEGQMGLEPTPEEYIANMVKVFREVKRVLKDDGTLWLNVGDSYAAPGKNRTEEQSTRNSTMQGGLAGQSTILKQQSKIVGDLKPKDLVGIPWMLAFALRADGWYLRQDIIWSKPNPMPESVTDRCTKSHEYIFMLSKSQRYYYDHEAIKTPPKESSIQRWSQDIDGQNGSDRVPGKTKRGHSRRHAGFNDRWDKMTLSEQQSMGANKRSVWTVATKPFSEAHFATFPPELIVDCIKAGCPENGIVFDPFMGAGTTALVARKLNRNYIGRELNPEYIKISDRRMEKELGMFQ